MEECVPIVAVIAEQSVLWCSLSWLDDATEWMLFTVTHGV